MEKNKKKKESLTTFYAVSLALQLGFLIVFSIGGFFVLGFWFDEIFKTIPLFIILGVIIGFIFTIFEIYHLLKPLIEKKDDR